MKTSIFSAGSAWLARIAQTVQRHPKRLTSAIAAMMLSAGGAAFAVAELGPDPTDIPLSIVATTVSSLVDGSSLADLAELNTFSLYRTEYTRSSDSADSLLQRLGIADPAAAEFLRSDDVVRKNLLGRSGRMVSAEASNDHQLIGLTARWVQDESSGYFQRMVITRSEDGGFSAKVESAPLTVSTRLSSSTIYSNLFAATDAANIPDNVATQIADIFPEVDFRRLHRGDRFTLMYETLEGDGEVLRAGRVLAAEFKNRGRTHQAMWFQEGDERGAYYAMDGSSLRRAYLTSPVEFSRVSSGFSMRLHPIHKTWRKHLGTDYAAPTGTKVRTVGDGVVEFAGWQNGFGNVIFIKHTNTAHVTVYAHLSRIDVAKGQRVDQGDNIGAVGSTGWSTGPHLHFEFRVNGEHKDPLSIVAAPSNANPISESIKKAFQEQADMLRVQLASAELIHQATAQ